MFYDERINHECGKIYRWGIGGATAISALYGVFRGIYLRSIGYLHIAYLLTELSIVTCGIIILLIGAFRFWGQRDERSEYEKHQYYLDAAKVFLITGLAGYAVSVSVSRNRPVNDMPVNFLIVFLEVLGAIYLFYTFKTRDINFNYTVIGEDKKTYYTHVYGNMKKLSGILFISFLFASTLGIILHRSVMQFISIWLAYLWSCVGLSLEYLFISWIEKRSYDEETPVGLKQATVIAGIAMLVSRLIVLVVNLWYVHVATGDLQAYPAAGAYLARISYAKLGMSYYFSVLAVLALSHLLIQIKRGKKTLRAVRGVIIMSVVALLIDLGRRLFWMVASEELIQLYIQSTDYYVLGMMAINLLLLCGVIRGLIYEFHATRILWILPAVRILAFALRLFFVSQSLQVIAVAVEEVMILMSIACGLWMLWKIRY